MDTTFKFIILVLLIIFVIFITIKGNKISKNPESRVKPRVKETDRITNSSSQPIPYEIQDKLKKPDKEYKLVCPRINLELQSPFLGEIKRVEKHANRLAETYNTTVVIYEQNNNIWKKWGVVYPNGVIHYMSDDDR